ncbi:acyltransferase family protein [Sinorhizobium sp. 7-81]|uniref:acyltransferase family protein n=1 Tax=Sinorhizobium sp. 8-89 TaxID=3049089 RepID=UPI0024C368F2|nr:acyltransferase family protein [Sinorhizobium sp. 8-89]MDK1493136.1 acyltransferase family protein [Sinorhizobium sp. 8-89]
MQYRPEVDGLRALAVVPVLLFHAGFDIVSGGFAGVDVFFVISGFLITSIIDKEIRDGRFSVVSFYERRARRLAPALLLVCAVCTAFALMWMLPHELNTFGKGLYATSLLGSNFQLWDQTGYFSPDTDQMPLLHMWSLAVEEQFYLVFPLLLIALRRFPGASVLAVVLGISALSFGSTQVLARLDPSANFYLLPSRFWELALGAAVAFSGLSNAEVGKPVREVLAALGLLAIVATYLFVRESAAYPGWATVPVVVGTAAFIAFGRADTLAGKCLSMRPLVAVGLCSYSLYLWHQPVLAFARLRLNDDITPAGYGALIGLCFVLAYLTWRHVETPFRDRRRFGRRPVFAMTLGAGAVAVIAGLSIDQSDGFEARNLELARLNEPSVGIGKDCDGVVGLKCSTGDNPEIAVWGDSFARHLVDGARASDPDVRLVQLTKNNCGPFFDLAPVIPSLALDWPQQCLDHNEDVRRFLLAHKSVRYVVLSSPLTQYLREDTVFLRGKGLTATSPELLVENFQSTLAWLRSNGVQPVVVSPPPRDGRNTGLCIARARLLGLPSGECDLPVAAVEAHDKDVRAVLESVARDFPVLNFTDYLCDASNCRAEDDGVPIYEDDGHFSEKGSRHIGRTLDFSRAFVAAAAHGCAQSPDDSRSSPHGNCGFVASRSAELNSGDDPDKRTYRSGNWSGF